jgi:murein DD-endopeptidase MepM/ murein hydrolase activator NlpD
MNGPARLQVGIPANRKPGSGHPKPRMRRLLKLSIGFVVVMLLLAVTGIGGLLVDNVAFYARVAHLYTQEPDRKIAMPLEDITKRQISDTWGAPRGTGRRHEGQDIFAPKGTPILSATNGYIYKIGENNLGGQTVSVIGAGGRVYYYAHLEKYAPHIEVGDLVTTRTVLGYVGTTGNAAGTPPHLHFGIYTMSGAINPLPLLTDRTAPRITESTAPRRSTPRSTPNRLRI